MPFRRRPNLVGATLRGLGLLLVLLLAAVAATALPTLGSLAPGSRLAGSLGPAASLALNTALFGAAFRVLTARAPGWRDL